MPAPRARGAGGPRGGAGRGTPRATAGRASRDPRSLAGDPAWARPTSPATLWGRGGWRDCPEAVEGVGGLRVISLERIGLFASVRRSGLASGRVGPSGLCAVRGRPVGGRGGVTPGLGRAGPWERGPWAPGPRSEPGAPRGRGRAQGGWGPQMDGASTPLLFERRGADSR